MKSMGDEVGKILAKLPPRLTPEELAAAEAREDEQRVKAREAHEAREQAKLGDHLAGCGVPEAIRATLLNSALQQSRAVELAAKWFRSAQRFLVLLGAPGTGKTTAAASVLAEVRQEDWTYETGRSWVWCTRHQSFSDAQVLARLDYFGHETRAVLERLSLMPILVVDELGEEFMSAPWLATFQEVVNRRYSENRRTVLVGNLSFEAFEQRYGRRVADRIRETGAVIDLGEADQVRKARW